ncbi:MAG: hypothetical protein ACR2L2_09950 [Acidobacteriota bacterium]
MSKVLTSLLLLTVLGGADITGKWSGTIEVVSSTGESRTIPAFLILKQEGNKITGAEGQTKVISTR